MHFIQSLFFAVYVNIADLHFDLNAYENAYINYQKALELNFDCFQALMGIVRIYAHRLQWDECYKFAKQAYQIEPTSSQSSFWFATSLYQLNRPNEAIKIFYKALDINPDSARTHFFLACSLEASAQQTTALFHYEKATELDNQFAEAFLIGVFSYLKLAYIMMHLKNISKQFTFNLIMLSVYLN